MTLKLLDGVQINTVGNWIPSEGFQGMLVIGGDLGSGTVIIEIEDQTGTAVAIQDPTQTPINSFLAVGAISQFSIPSGLRVRARLTGSTSPNAFVWLV